MSRVEVVVLGAGINGLVAATKLARSGKSVLLVDRRDGPGGLAGFRTFEGSKVPGPLNDTSTFAPEVAQDLGLAKHGFARDVSPETVLQVGDSEASLTLTGDVPADCAAISGHSEIDARRYEEFVEYVSRLRSVLRPWLVDLPPDVANAGATELLSLATRGLSARRLGKKIFRDLFRLPPMCVADWMREWFSTELLSCALSVPALSGSQTAPWSPASNANLLRFESLREKPVRGGALGLIEALARAAEASGVQSRFDSRVASIRVKKNVVEGVDFASGDSVECETVLSTCDPKTTFLSLIGRVSLEPTLAHRLERFRASGAVAHVTYVMSEAAEFVGAKGPVSRVRSGASFDDFERAFDATKYGRLSDRPWLDVYVPPSKDAHVISIAAHFAPYALRDGWSDEQRAELDRRVAAELERLAPGASARIVAREMLTPPDLETSFGLAGGHLHHGEHALDQLVVRPLPEAFRYATPIRGLFLGGAGSHPGGGVTGLPGWLGARAVLGGK